MTRLVIIKVILLTLAGALTSQSGFFRSYNHAPLFSDGKELEILNDSTLVGLCDIVNTSRYGFGFISYSIASGNVVDSIVSKTFQSSISARGLSTGDRCAITGGVQLIAGFPNRLFVRDMIAGELDTISITYNEETGRSPLFVDVKNGFLVYEPEVFEQTGNRDQQFNGVSRLFSSCGEFLSVDTLYRDTIGRSRLVPNYSDQSKYLLRDQDRQNLMLLKYDGVKGDFVKVRPLADNELVAVRHYDDLIVADRLFYYERDGFDLYDETIAVFDDSLDLVWEATFIPDRTELVPSYYWETRSIHVDDQYITVVGAEDRGENLPNSIESTNHLYSTRYTVDGELVWFRRYDAIDSLLALYIVSDVEVSDDGSVFAYGYYTHRNPPTCDTCPLTRNTFLLKLDSDGYLDGPPTSVEEEVVTRSVTIYPNPATARLTISSVDVIEQVSIHHIDGRLAYREDGLSSREYTVDVSGLHAGLYVVSVTDDTGRVSTGKVLVND